MTSRSQKVYLLFQRPVSRHSDAGRFLCSKILVWPICGGGKRRRIVRTAEADREPADEYAVYLGRTHTVSEDECPPTLPAAGGLSSVELG